MAGRVSGLVWAGVATVLGVTVLAGVAVVRTTTEPDGQLVAVPVQAVVAGPDGQELIVDSCTPLEDGLRIRGRVDDAEGQQQLGDQLVVAVTGSTERTAGRAVGLGFAASADLADVKGAFVLDVPWAEADSQLAIVSPGSPASRVPATGPVARCPSG